MKKRFTTLLNNNRLVHAYLFEGDGNELAMWLTKQVFCKIISDEPCGECSSCRRINVHNHPDVHVIEPDGQAIKIDQIRLLQKEAAYKGVEGSKQVFIIKQADRMNPQASNALLKFLEEPFQDTLSILIADKRDSILPTILSRVQTIRIDVSNSLEREARSKGYTSHKSLPILSTVMTSIEEFEKHQEVVDEWTALIRATFELSQTQATLSVQTAWLERFSDKSTQLISIRLVQSYVKSLWLAKRDQKNPWGLASRPNYTWNELLLMQQLVDELGRGFYSNQHYLLGLEKFFLSKPVA
ncbi:DNA polymerase III subunit delta' [Sporosarcina sp. E16_3]|uniref:DNA polymerase III subunit delta' n=2 Tax=unclassified Sporosarcina TaxID=2647733 RepID=UPI001A933FA8|nr:DNA polymerase III subunit delta' [Sporosarcina sp. E16_3]